jgi:hypothetical protein
MLHALARNTSGKCPFCESEMIPYFDKRKFKH